MGCGDGALATRLAEDGAEVTGLDASTVMIAAARRRADAVGVEIGLVKGGVGDLPFPAGQFDRVVSVIEAIDAGMSARAAAARFSVGASTAINWHRRWRETGMLEAGRQGKRNVTGR